MFNLEAINQRVGRLTFLDIKLIKLAVFFASIIIVKLFPQLLNIRISFLLALTLLCSLRPFYNFWFRK